MLTYRAGPTGQKFLDSKAFVKGIMGPIGSGKSTVAIMDLMQRAINQKPFNNVRRTKFGLMRNTQAQLKATVRPLIDTWFVTMTNGTMGTWRVSEAVFEVRFKLPDDTIVHSEFCMLAADTPDDVRRLLSLELSAAWVEESREIDPEVFQGLQGRVNRYPSRIAGGVTYPGLIFSTNPPPLGSYWHETISNPPSNTEVFIQPPALLPDGQLNPERENQENLAPDYYENVMAGKTEGWTSVYLMNQYGAGDYGQPVYRSSFKKSFHVADEPLSPIPQSSSQLIVGMDNGLQSACVIGQQDMRGRINILGECYVPADETMGVEQFLSKYLVPKLRREYANFRPENILFVMDPACWQRSQANELQISTVVAAMGYKTLKANTNDPERRVAAVESLLVRQIDGKAGLLIDPSCQHLVNATEWGFRYKKNAAGQGTLTFDKNHFSHISDAMHYLCGHFQGNIAGIGYGFQSKAREIVRKNYKYT
jgi:hypothetical protein